MSNHINNELEVVGPESDLLRFITAFASGGGIPLPCDFGSLVPATTQESWKRWIASDALIPAPDKRPLVLFFESISVPPDELVKKMSLAFPTLVFGLRFVESWGNYHGWIVFHNGNECGFGWNDDIYRFGNHSGGEARARESLNPDGAMIDLDNKLATSCRDRITRVRAKKFFSDDNAESGDG